jgi:alcohol dehydrogenase class IV
MALSSLKADGLAACVFDRVRVEPNSESIEAAIAFASNNTYDAVLAVGGVRR